MNKVCFKCHQEKDAEDFYRHPKMGDGHVSKCKECTKDDVSKNRHEMADYYRAYDVSRAILPHRKAMALTNSRRLNKEVPGYMKSHNAVARAVKSGRLIRQACQMCSRIDVHAHHDDYSKPLEVLWLCPVHHKARHAFLEYIDSQKESA
jgi:hypothetical protein